MEITGLLGKEVLLKRLNTSVCLKGLLAPVLVRASADPFCVYVCVYAGRPTAVLEQLASFLCGIGLTLALGRPSEIPSGGASGPPWAHPKAPASVGEPVAKRVGTGIRQSLNDLVPQPTMDSGSYLRGSRQCWGCG